MINAEVVADSVNYNGIRLTTLKLIYPRFIHAEFMTHRMFCLSGESRLDFELPSGEHNGGRRVHHMSIREFAKKWFSGSKTHQSSRHNGIFLDHLTQDDVYTADEIAKELQYINSTNINTLCRTGKIKDVFKQNRKWAAKGSSWIEWRKSTGSRTFSLKNRLQNMSIRQLNEITKEVVTSKVVNVFDSGVKPVFRITAGDYSLVCTKDHLVFTQDGWKKVRDLSIGIDKIYTYKYGTGVNPEKYKKIDGKWVSTWVNQVKNQIAARQDNKCAITGNILEEIFDIHHIIPKHIRPDLAFDIDNIIAITPEAHKIIHKKQGWQIGVALTTTQQVVESIEPEGEIDTYDLEIAGEFPNFFADGIVVHNSRNASSSRAEPVAKHIERIENEYAEPIHWGQNQPGMQAKAEVAQETKKSARSEWWAAKESAIKHAKALNALGVHKQIVNRILEPFSHINVVVTATEWDNFFELRLHPDAQPEIHELARVMKDAMDKSIPMVLSNVHWHLPFVTRMERKGYYSDEDLLKFSVARCARVSYLTHDKKEPNPKDDIALFARLVDNKPAHASPTEHQAIPLESVEFCRNFRGWMQYRELLEAAQQ